MSTPFFNAINGNHLEIGGLSVDVNPISLQKTGTLGDYLTRAEAYLDRKELHKAVYAHLANSADREADVLQAAKNTFPKQKEIPCRRFCRVRQFQSCVSKPRLWTELMYMERESNKTKESAAVDHDSKVPRTSVLSKLQEKQKQVKASSARSEDKKRGIEL